MGAKFILVNCRAESFAHFMADFYIHCFTITSFREFDQEDESSVCITSWYKFQNLLMQSYKLIRGTVF